MKPIVTGRDPVYSYVGEGVPTATDGIALGAIYINQTAGTRYVLKTTGWELSVVTEDDQITGPIILLNDTTANLALETKSSGTIGLPTDALGDVVHYDGVEVGGFRISKNLAHRKAATYSTTVGGLSYANQRLLALFAEELWSITGTMCDFWTWRSEQNKGSGTTSYSFLGQTTTINTTNTPWSTNGMQVLTGQILPLLAAYEFREALYEISVRALTDVATDVYALTSATADNFTSLMPKGSVGKFQVGSTESDAVSLTNNAFFFGSLSRGALGKFARLNGVSKLATTGSAITPVVEAANTAYSNNAVTTTVALEIILNKQLTLTEDQAIYAAYKNTIGSGLSLP